MENAEIVAVCRRILAAYKSGMLGQTIMPEDTNPTFSEQQIEVRLSYFTLPMALNYQRDSYKLWEAALKTFNDSDTKFVFDVHAVSARSDDEVRAALMKYKLALQPNKHVNTWRTIAATIDANWGSFENLIIASHTDFVQLKQIIQSDYKKGFPYLSGPKIFNYWSFILSTYGGVQLSNRDQIDIAPDTHITQCSVRLQVIGEEEALTLSKEEVSRRWREVLKGSGIDPIDMHSPFWFWSRNGFIFTQ
jgi:hypothetical protein